MVREWRVLTGLVQRAHFWAFGCRGKGWAELTQNKWGLFSTGERESVVKRGKNIGHVKTKQLPTKNWVSNVQTYLSKSKYNVKDTINCFCEHRNYFPVNFGKSLYIRIITSDKSRPCNFKNGLKFDFVWKILTMRLFSEFLIFSPYFPSLNKVYNLIYW